MRGAVLEEVNGRVLKLPMRFLTTMLAAGIACAELLGQASPAPSSPTYKILRQDEDWSGLASEQNRQPGFFDRLKYVPLDESRSVWVSFGGQLRERVEGWDQFNFGAPAGAAHNDSFLLSRLFLHTDLHLGEHVRFFIQEKSAFSTHRDLLGGRRTQDADELDLQNAFLDLSLPVSDSGTFTFRAGR